MLNVNINLEHKKQLLREILEKKNKKPLLASREQQSLWTFSETNPESPAYHLKFAALVTPAINIELLESSLQFLINRHSVLRSYFQFDKDGKLYQYVDNTFQCKVIEKNIVENELQQNMQEDYARPFDLSKPTLLRVFLYNIENKSQALLIVIHHIIMDGLSLFQFINELGIMMNGKIDQLHPLPFEYRHYLIYQQNLLEQPEYLKSKEYWIHHLSGSSGYMPLPYEVSFRNALDYQSHSVKKTLSTTVTEALKLFAHKQKITVHSLLLGIYQLLLYSISAQKDIFCVTPCLGREKKEFLSVLGYFASMVVMRVNVDPSQSLSEFFKASQQLLKDAMLHQAYSFSKILEDFSDIRNDAKTLPFAQAAFAFHQFIKSGLATDVELNPRISSEFHWEKAKITPFRVPSIACQFDLYLIAREEITENISLSFEYKKNLFAEHTIEVMANYFIKLIDAILMEEDQSIASLPRYPGRIALENTVSSFNQTAKTMPEMSMTTLCHQSLLKHAKSIAIVDNIGEHSYLKLLYLSFGFAEKLPKNVTSEPIGILLEKNHQQIAAVLGVLFSGNFFVPINLDNPAARVNEIIAKANIKYIITNKKIAALYHLDHCTIIDADDIFEIKNYEIKNVTLNQLAYVIFTSGTTGTPKGVAISHRALVNTIVEINDKFSITNQDSIFAISDLSFDLAMYDVFGIILAGGRIVMCPTAHVKEPKEWLKLIDQYQITTWNSVPMLFSMLLQLKKNLPFKKIFLSGDWINVELVKESHEWCKNAEVVSLGGPTETTIWSICYPLQRDVDYEFIPYGFPLANHKYYVLNEDLNLCQLGQVGELYAAGLGLAECYYNDPKTTDKYFIKHPQFGRIYRTGDVGYMTDNFGIRIKGRLDRQVKIGGFRIELDDVRLALEKSFHEYKVICHIKEMPHKRIVAYIENQNDIERDNYIVDNIKEDKVYGSAYQHLLTLLPEFMIPDIFFVMKSLPLSKNNKIDYHALPDMNQYTHSNFLKRVFNEKEEQIARIWADTLKIPFTNIHVDSHFFHLGGDSLSAVSVINAIDMKYHVSSSLKMLFDFPVLQSFVKAISELEQENVEQLVLAANTYDRYQPFQLTPIQQAYYIGRQNQIELGEVSSHSYYEFDLENFDIQRFQSALDQTIQSHDMLRVVIKDENQQQVLENVPSYPLEMIDVSHCDDSDLTEKLMQWREKLSHEIIDMRQFPTFHIKALQLKKVTRILISYDSIQFDAWSFLIFMRDLCQLYFQKVSSLSVKVLQFRDYIQYLDKLSHHASYLTAKQYWYARIPHLPLGPQLPVSMRSVKQVFKRMNGTLSIDKWNKLKSKAKEMACTPTCLILTIFSFVIRYYSRSPHFCLNLTLFNRPNLHSDIHQLIGDFTSLILFEVKDIPLPIAFSEYLTTMQQQLISDLDHRVYDGVNVQRDIRRHHKNISQTIAPVVFTSTLGFDQVSSFVDEMKHLVKVNYSITQTPQVWLDNQIKENQDGLHWVWDYLDGLFDANTIYAMHELFKTILHHLTEKNWDQYQLHGLLPKEVQQWMDFNNTANDMPNEMLIDSILRTCHAYPESIAIVDDIGEMTYQDLYQSALNLSSEIQAYNYHLHSPIGILFEKGRNQVIACLSVLLSGHYFVPLNILSPRNRLMLVMDEAHMVAVITNTTLLKKFDLPEEKILNIDFLKTTTYTKIIPSNPSDTAYVIFTSGTTGKPKGVVISHESVMNTLLDMNQRFSITHHDSVLAISDLSFDLAIFDIFGLLIAGGRIIFPSSELCKEPSHWLTLIKTNHITIWNSVPMLYAMLLHAMEPLPTIKTVLLSGDWIMPNLIKKGFTLCPTANHVALGGATECSIWSNYFILEAHKDYDYIPYGFPLTNQTMYVLNKALSPCPEGIEGEIYIGGRGVAKEYYQDPEKTNHAFINHPEFGRIYHTGDWGQLTSHQGIKFLGRKDRQIKLGGYRIELNEVESILRKNLLFDDIYIDVQDVHGSKQMVAYCVQPSNDKDKVIDKLSLNKNPAFPSKLNIINVAENLEDKNYWFKRKSYRHWIQSDFPLQMIKEKLTQISPYPMGNTKNALQSALQLLREVHHADNPLPKYQYPSAGGLYSVKCFISIASNHDKISKGCYYFSSKDAMLIQINENPMNDVDEILLIADTTLIKTYYPSKWQLFSEIEAGHIVSLLNKYLYLSYREEAFSNDTLSLSEQYTLIVRYEIQHQNENTVTIPSFHLCLQQSKLCYYYNAEKNAWIDEESIYDIYSLDQNAKMIKSAWGVIIFDSTTDAITIGRYAQSLMESFMNDEIGCCYISNFFVKKENSLQKHHLGIVFGKVPQETMQSHKISNNPTSQSEILHEVYTRLKSELPEYMIPSDFVLLNTLPLSANGKIDINALPKKNLTSSSDSINIEDAFTLRIADIWKKVLNISDNVILYQNSNFFMLGGDSLKALEMLSLINAEQNQKIELKTIFDFPELKLFCDHLRLYEMQQIIDSSEFVTLKNIDEDSPIIILVHPSTGTIDCFLHLAHDFDAKYNLIAIQYKNTSFTNLYDLAEHYATEISETFKNRKIHLLGYSLGAYIAFEIAKVLENKNVAYESIALVDALPVYLADEIFFEQQGEMNVFEKSLMEEYAVSRDKIHLYLSYIYDRQHALIALSHDYKTTGQLQRGISYFKAMVETPNLKSKIDASKNQWKKHSHAEVIEFMVDGNHMNIFSQKHVITFREKYLRYLNSLSDNINARKNC